MEADFLSIWNNIILFRVFFFCLREPENQIFEKQSYFCKWKLIFWPVETIFIFPFWDTPATASFIFSSSENIFLNAIRLVERDFLASRNAFLPIFQTFLPVIFITRLMET